MKGESEKSAFARGVDARHRQERGGFEHSRVEIEDANRAAALGNEQSRGVAGRVRDEDRGATPLATRSKPRIAAEVEVQQISSRSPATAPEPRIARMSRLLH